MACHTKKLVFSSLHFLPFPDIAHETQHVYPALQVNPRGRHLRRNHCPCLGATGEFIHPSIPYLVDAMSKVQNLGHFMGMNGRDRDGEQLLTGIAQQGTGLGVDIKNGIAGWINNEDRIIAVAKDVMEQLLAFPQGFLDALALSNVFSQGNGFRGGLDLRLLGQPRPAGGVDLQGGRRIAQRQLHPHQAPVGLLLQRSERQPAQQGGCGLLCSPAVWCQEESRSQSSCRRPCHWRCCWWTHSSKGASSRSQKPSRNGPRTRESACWTCATRAARCSTDRTVESLWACCQACSTTTRSSSSRACGSRPSSSCGLSRG